MSQGVKIDTWWTFLLKSSHWSMGHTCASHKHFAGFFEVQHSCLQGLKCNMHDPSPLGEGAGVGWTKGSDKMQISRDATLFELVQAGIINTHTAVGVVVRLREELSKVTSVPVLIAIDQYNNWFTFTDYEEPVTVRSCRSIHARDLATVKAFRSMMHENMMVAAFSHSTAVGKLRQELPDVPLDARINFHRYNLDEADTVCHYYLRTTGRKFSSCGMEMEQSLDTWFHLCGNPKKLCKITSLRS